MSNRSLITLGLDDTDSTSGMCTTYLTHRLVDRLLKRGALFEDYPHLVRLNPNIPWKTRGNGAVSLKFRVNDPVEAFEEACRTVEEYSDAEHAADPGLVVSTFPETPLDISELTERALSDVVSISEATHLIKKHNLLFKGWGRRRGLIGALAAIGCSLNEDATYELLAFRSEANWGCRRAVDSSSIVEMSRATYPYTFNNYDEEKERVLMTPRGPDPVLLGVRGETPETVLQAYRMLKIGEDVSGYMILKTNQGTGAHLKPELNLSSLKAYRSGHFEGTVLRKPEAGRGGHVYLTVKNERGAADCAAYEPTGRFRKTVLSLLPGDRVEVGGSVRRRSLRHPSTVNMEYLSVVELVGDVRFTNPLCRLCGRRMASQGRGQGFRCDSCGFEDRAAEKIRVEKSRTVRTGFYLPPPRAQRHLTKPLQRYLLSRRTVTTGLIERWFEPPPLTTRLKT